METTKKVVPPWSNELCVRVRGSPGWSTMVSKPTAGADRGGEAEVAVADVVDGRAVLIFPSRDLMISLTASK